MTWRATGETLVERPMVWLALRTMSASGHLREAAIEALAVHSAPLVAPFLVLRTVDWVPAVADLARNELAWRVELDDAATAAALPVALAIAARNRAGDVAQALADRMGPDRPALTERLLASPDPQTRRFAMRQALERDILTAAALTDVALHDRDVVMGTLAGTAAVGRMVAAGDLASLPRLLGGRAAVRRAMVDALPLDVLGRRIVEGLLFDRSSLVRAGARARLEIAGTDVRQLCRVALADPERRRAAVLELGRWRVAVQGLRGLPIDAAVADAAIVRPWLADDRPAVRAASVQTLGALLWDAAVADVLPLLEDPSPRVTRAAADVLVIHPEAVPMSTLVEVAGPARPLHVRSTAIRLIRQRSPVARILVDLLTVREPGPLGDAAVDDLRAWLSTVAVSQPRPSVTDRRQLADELTASRLVLPPGMADLVAFHLGLRRKDLP